ncbi:prepilin-type N-terminal cleavage/methylation domain-containing protein [Clostridium sp. Cult3]|uniref:prepilin-type N-terminal cleavage/methylation domain-containing protein n=1 Tax=Clostridium sp. Cult3 TaxID=2079004 RepID=UPI001F4317F7|nr:prepilin-type N-terminal cleavage/methylation domain-containing protein [Clostridium sp. Cult3]
MDRKGFTLIEVMLVISILGIFLLIPALKGTIASNFKERKELRTFKKDIEYARNRAIVESTMYSVYMNFEDNFYCINKYEDKEVVLKKYEFKNGIKLKGTKNMGNQLAFSYLGIPSKAGTIYLEDKNGDKIEITITPVTGKVNIYQK